MSEGNLTNEEKAQVLGWALWNETAFPFEGVDDTAKREQADIIAMLEQLENGIDPGQRFNEWSAAWAAKQKETEQTDCLTA